MLNADVSDRLRYPYTPAPSPGGGRKKCQNPLGVECFLDSSNARTLFGALSQKIVGTIPFVHPEAPIAKLSNAILSDLNNLTITRSDGVTLNSELSGKALSSAVFGHRHWKGTDPGGAYQDIANYEKHGVQPIVLRGLLAIMDGEWDVHVSCVKTGHHIDGLHNPNGIAVDLNNYGPGGAWSHLKNSTSSTNPARFVAWLKANRVALGNPRIFGGSTRKQSTQWGTDGPDRNDHIHLDWKAKISQKRKHA